MYAICDVNRPLSDAFYSRFSLSESLLYFHSLFPCCKQALVFRDLSSRGRLEDLQFICLFKKFDKLSEEYEQLKLSL